MRCPRCGGEDVIVLVHSMRALCGTCMTQWSPSLEDAAAAMAVGSAAASARDLRAARRGRPDTN